MGVAGSPLPGPVIATGIRKSFNPGYLGHVLAQGPGLGYPLQEVLQHNSLQQPPLGWPPQQQPKPPSPPRASHQYPVFRTAGGGGAGGGLPLMGSIRGESLARTQHGIMMSEGPGGGMYYGPASAMVGPGGARLVPGRPEDGGPGHLSPGRAMYLNRQQHGPPYIEPLCHGGPGSPGLPVMVEGRQPPGYHSPGKLVF